MPQKKYKSYLIKLTAIQKPKLKHKLGLSFDGFFGYNVFEHGNGSNV